MAKISITIFYISRSSSCRYRDGERLDRTTETVRIIIIAYLNMIDRIFEFSISLILTLEALCSAIHEFMCTYSQGIYLNGFSFFFLLAFLSHSHSHVRIIIMINSLPCFFFLSFSHAFIFLFFTNALLRKLLLCVYLYAHCSHISISNIASTTFLFDYSAHHKMDLF